MNADKIFTWAVIFFCLSAGVFLLATSARKKIAVLNIKQVYIVKEESHDLQRAIAASGYSQSVVDVKSH